MQQAACKKEETVLKISRNSKTADSKLLPCKCLIHLRKQKERMVVQRHVFCVVFYTHQCYHTMHPMLNSSIMNPFGFYRSLLLVLSVRFYDPITTRLLSRRSLCWTVRLYVRKATKVAKKITLLSYSHFNYLIIEIVTAVIYTT